MALLDPRPSPVPRPRTPSRVLAVVLGVVLAVVAGVGGTAPPASAASPPSAVAPAGTGWGWPLEASGGPPAVLRAFTAPAHRWSPGHRGVDLAVAAGTPVLAPADGVVAFAGRVVDRGVVSIAVRGGLRVALEPVAATVAAGAVVHRGQQIGVVEGSAGHCAPQTCLHWGVRAGPDAYRDPLALLRPPGPPVLLPRGPVAAPWWGSARRAPR